MKKFLMLLVLLALFVGIKSYAQPYVWPLEPDNTGYLTLDEDATNDYYDPALVTHVLNPTYGYHAAGLQGPAGIYIEGGDYGTLPSGVSRTRLLVQVVAHGYVMSDDFDASSDEVIGNGVVDVYLGATFDWYLYHDVMFEYTEEYSDGTWEDFIIQWD